MFVFNPPWFCCLKICVLFLLVSRVTVAFRCSPYCYRSQFGLMPINFCLIVVLFFELFFFWTLTCQLFKLLVVRCVFHTISPLECFLAGCELYHALLDTNLFAVSIFCSSSDVQALILTCLLRTIFYLDPTFQSVYLKYTLCFF